MRKIKDANKYSQGREREWGPGILRGATGDGVDMDVDTEVIALVNVSNKRKVQLQPQVVFTADQV